MSLFDLPPEILLQVFNDVGSDFFQSDISRLTGFEKWKRRGTTCDPQDRERGRWSNHLNYSLLELAGPMQKSPKLCTLRIRAFSEMNPRDHRVGRRDYLYLYAVHHLLTAAFLSNLTNLSLDLCGTRLCPRGRQENNEAVKGHTCPLVAGLLGTLRCLRLRLRRICPDALRPWKHLEGTKLPLEEALVNLSLTNESPLVTAAGHATRCGGTSVGEFLQRKADMEAQAHILATLMATPRKVRILTHTLPSMEMRAFDVLSGRTMALAEGSDWGDDGEGFEEEVSDEESEISDLSWDDDG
ncbi:hypothetical protein M011DRAFT_458990 [Sporormia fimetaria CBS 119925]|uniref:F-box domain-containing protein n=1 Tax=Sporormia fimetaria CBS 119925 TaxID=1340428 RepID=A0A6A6V8Z1_9PLEO|nr:hypothetical protein M011DRAFT_458990 [Sporormia fimetaria CBS 119925]